MNTKMVQLLSPVIIIVMLSGCSSLRNGGAPDMSFDIEKDLSHLSKEFESSTNITDYYAVSGASNRKDARNRFISGRLVQIDLQYLKFIRTLTSNKQQLNAATDIALLSINLAGTIVSSAQAKTNLAAAGLIGIKTTIDKE